MPRYAAIDIGSNSIRMLAAEVTPGHQPETLAEDRQVTRIGESVFASGAVNRQTLDLVVAVLRRMRECYTRFDVAGVRAVATSAVRDAKNQADFLHRAEEALGLEVETISGLEEARLIHMGVMARPQFQRGRHLLIDIGGGSAELIVSRDGSLEGAFSKPLGAVRLWQSFLKNNPPTALEVDQLDEYVNEKLEEPLASFGKGGFLSAIGTSASASAAICTLNGIPRAKRETADGVRGTAQQLEGLRARLAPLNLEQRQAITGIGPRRAEIILPGVTVLSRALSAFAVSDLVYCSAGVRDGIVIDLAQRGVGKERVTLTEEQRGVVERVAERFGVDLVHVRKVSELAIELFVGLERLHRLPHWYGRILHAACHLHDVGHFVSATKHHKHSHYIVSNVDLPGFTEMEQRLVSVLCRYHRKSMPTATHPEFASLSSEFRRAILCLVPLFRIADACDRSKSQRVLSVGCRMNDNGITIQLHHRSAIDLEWWAVERSAETFRQVYHCDITLQPVLVEPGHLSA